MAVPANITYVAVTGRYVDASGAGMTGTITFKPLADRILDTGVNTGAQTIDGTTRTDCH